jgi:hypothetical protein
MKFNNCKVVDTVLVKDKEELEGKHYWFNIDNHLFGKEVVIAEINMDPTINKIFSVLVTYNEDGRDWLSHKALRRIKS